MGERDLRGTWKGRGRTVSPSSTPIIGVVYRGKSIDGVSNVIGMLQIFDKEQAQLVDRDGVMHIVTIKSLSSVYDDD